MSQPDPQQPFLKSGGYGKETDIFADLQNLLRNFATKKLRPSRSSPPILADVGELEFIWDKTLKRLYTKSDNVLYYVQFT